MNEHYSKIAYESKRLAAALHRPARKVFRQPYCPEARYLLARLLPEISAAARLCVEMQ